MSADRALLVASNDTHVAMFAPVVATLGRRGVSSAIVSLDGYYGQGSSVAAEGASLPMIELRGVHSGAPPTAFYARSVVAVWRDTLDARRALRKLMADERPTIVAFGNDHGLIEKAAIREARRVGAHTVLVQDGRLAPRPRPSGPRAQLARLLKRGFSPALRLLGLGYLAASDYGSGGTHVICATGEASAEILAARTRLSRIVVTGQPRYDRLAAIRATEEPRFDAMVFTSPFRAAGLGGHAQSAQEALVRDLHRWGTENGRRIAVKPHPREQASGYQTMVGADSVVGGDPSVAMAAARVAVIGMSTVLDEASLLGRPVVVPGSMIHGPGMERLLPPRDIYPRGDSFFELVGLIEEMSDPAALSSLVERQADFAQRQVMHDPRRPAATRVVEAMLGA